LRKFTQYLQNNGFSPKRVNRIVLTRVHRDHIGSLKALVRDTGAKTYSHWAGISHTTALRTKNTEAVFGFGLFLTFPLLFMSTTLMANFFMPEWMKIVSKYNPISFTVDALTALMLTGFDWNVIGQSYAVMAGFEIVTIGAATLMFRRAVE